jgi:uncharacterized protein YceK
VLVLLLALALLLSGCCSAAATRAATQPLLSSQPRAYRQRSHHKLRHQQPAPARAPSLNCC